MASISLDKFTGLDTVADWAMTPDDKLVACRNLDLTDQGFLKKRSGFSTITSSALQSSKAIRLLARYTTPTFDRLIYHVAADLDLFYCLPDGTSNTTISTSTGSVIEWAAQYGTELFLIYKNQDLSRYNGTVYAGFAITDPHSWGTHLVFWKDRGWIVNSDSNYDVLRYSNIAAFTGGSDWANSEDIGFGDGDYLVCTVPYNDQLIIFKSKSTWMLDTGGSADPDDWILRTLNPNIGCVSRSTPVVFENLLYFESHDGVYRTDLSNFEELSAPIRDRFVARAIDRNTTTYADFAAIIDDRYILYTDDGVSPKFWIYNLRVGGWTEYTPGSSNIAPNGMFAFPDRSPGSLYFGTKQAVGHIFRFGDPTILQDFVGSTNFSYTAFMQTGYMDMGESSTWKRMRRANVDFNGRSSNIQAQWHYPNNTSKTAHVLDNSPGAQAVYRTVAPMPVVERFQSVSFSLTDNGNNDLSVYSLNMDLREKDVVAKAVNA